jgi:protein-disulfide isomerase
MKRMRLLMASALAGLMLGGTAVLAAAFDDTQKGEIEGIIKEYLMKNPEIIRDAMQELERRQAEQEAHAQLSAIKDNAAAIYRAEHDLIGGNPEGNISVVEFFDYNCGYCKRAFKDVMTMIEKDKDVRLVMKEFPILGPGSVYAAKAALASREQGKYWEFHMALLEHNGRIDEAAVDKVAEQSGLDLAKLRKDMEDPKVMQALQANMQLAESLRINGTPAFIIDQMLIPGAVGYDSLAAAIDDVRKAGGCKIC